MILLSGNLVWTTLCLGGYRPETMVFTSLLNGLTLVVHLLGRAWLEKAPRIHPVSWWFLPFLIDAAVNVMLVTPVQWLGWHDWLRWAQMILIFWVVLNGDPSFENAKCADGCDLCAWFCGRRHGVL